MQPSQLQLGMGVVKDTEAARAARQQAAAAGLAPPGVEHDVEAVNAALQVGAHGRQLEMITFGPQRSATRFIMSLDDLD